MKVRNFITLLGAAALSLSALADDIDNFNNGWAGKALKHQRQIERYAPLSQNSMIGTHNSYNSESYRNAIRYLDPQQERSVPDQLRMGARFLEFDAHWIYKAKFEIRRGGSWWQFWTYTVDVGGYEMVLCHGGVCSPDDRFFSQGLEDIRNFLNQDANKDAVIILYIEDHMDGNHGNALGSINSILGDKIYRSGSCRTIPSSLSKSDVLGAGKNIVIQGDRCSGNGSYDATVFSGLGAISRKWEDRTNIAAIAGQSSYIHAADIVRYHKEGVNLLNLDDMNIDDGRLEAAVWSFDVNEPNNWGGNQDCAVSWGNGRWDDAGCSAQFAYACQHQTNGNWVVSNSLGAWENGANACAAMGAGYAFDAPTNSVENEQLKTAKASANQTHVWLNLNDKMVEGNWQIIPSFTAEIKSMGKCLDGTSLSQGSNVHLWDCHGGGNQAWIFGADGTIRSAGNSNMCLDLFAYNTNNGGNIVVWPCNGAQNQKWILDGRFLRTALNGNQVIDVSGASTNNGSNIHIWSQHGGANQRWTFVKK